MNTNSPPNNLELERAVISAVLRTNGRNIDSLLPILKSPEYFYSPIHQNIWQTFLAMHREYVPIDLVTLNDRLLNNGRSEACGGAYYLVELSNDIEPVNHVESWAKDLQGYARRRTMAQLGQNLIEHAYAGDADPAEFAASAQQTIDKVLEGRMDVAAQKPSEIIRGYVKYLEDLEGRGGDGIKTHLYKLNSITGGMIPGEIIILAGRPSNGKTALALNFALHAIHQKVPVGIFSLEMMRYLLVNRLLSSTHGVEGMRFRDGKFSKEDWAHIYEFAQWFDGKDPWLRIWDKPSLSASELRAQCRRWKKEFGLKFAIIDYIQLLRPDSRGGSREREVAEISRMLKETATECGISLLVLAQLNRDVENRKNKIPLLSDLRESGAIEQDADQVIFIRPWDPKTINDIVEVTLDVAKSRNSTTGSLVTAYRRRRLQFLNEKENDWSWLDF
ncbi:replicative DNA helicase [Maridesulfovibrio ferrireducens]|uniref:replicative DNA helicase n=1 Tax=Maridesulfovibrio ferrireducens TaxID=246191 RepID=UPI001A306DBA|nr:replicative DNA helicase [Maridesulfovibrio ferrireducens]MBI9110345.1 replicative DNA helicase [Maridesulfovibrio ferrireducens]